MHVAILGGGIYGLACAWGLARLGHEVTVLDRSATLPSELASSTDQHRLIRHAYGPEPGYTRMVTDAFRVWDDLWSELGVRLYAPTGTLILGRNDPAGYVATTRAVLRDQRIPHEPLTAAAAASRFPVYETSEAEVAVHLPEGGTLFALDIAQALASHLASRGVRFLLGAEVSRIDPASPSLGLADGTTLRADRVVVAAGAWTSALFPDLDASLEPVLQTLAYLQPPPGLDWSEAPMLLAELTDEGSFYTVPPREGRGLKAGLHVRSGRVPANIERTPAPAALSTLRHTLPRHLTRAGDYRFASVLTCLYTMTAEERFRAWRRGATLILSCCSGHGFKFAPLIGRQVADLLAGDVALERFLPWLAGQDNFLPRAGHAAS